MRRTLLALTLVAVLPAAAASGGSAQTRAGDPRIAALQVGLRASDLYLGTIDGWLGPQTLAAIRTLQQRVGLPVGGLPGPALRRALGGFGRPSPTPLALGAAGFDVAALQFRLAWHGFPSGTFNGRFTHETQTALIRFQRFAVLPRTGIADAATLAALRGPIPTAPIVLADPLPGASAGDGFGPRGDRFHAGVDLAAPRGTPILAAAAGRVARAGALRGGFGLGVVVDDGAGVETLYAHLAKVEARRGDLLVAGAEIGLVGATGDANGPHLHFELHLRGAALDPAAAFTSSR